MRILVLSNTPWANDNSFGNSYSNIFDGIPDLQFANIYLRPGLPDNKFDMRFFQITEKSLIQNLKNPKRLSGTEIFPHENEGEVQKKTTIIGYEQARKMRWQFMFWVRDFIWKIGRWKSVQLQTFLEDFQPDLIFQPVYSKPYINDLALYMKEYTKAPMLGYISDDNYTLRQFNLSPLYWIDRLWSRKKVKAVIEKCEILYVISEIQKKEYEIIFNLPCKVLTKCADFSADFPEWEVSDNGVKILYAGNIGGGRWKSLGLICEAVFRLNQEGYMLQFDIYSATPQTKKMKKALNLTGSRLHSAVSYEEITALQKKSDILVHAEDLSLKSRMAVHQSFSTKLVDYFAMGKCIFAVGTEDMASIKHLKDHNAAVIAENKTMVYSRLKWLLLDTDRILRYGQSAYRCGAKCHNKVSMQNMLVEDLKKAERTRYESFADKRGV